MVKKQPSGRGYWLSQLLASAVIGIAMTVGGWAGITSETDEPGLFLMFILIGFLFLLTFVWLLRSYRSKSKKERAVFAWAVMQQMEKEGRNPRSDLEVLALAQHAADGSATPAEIEELQNLRSGTPYPGGPLPSTVVPLSGGSGTTMRGPGQ